MGQVFEEELRDLDRAIESYNDVLGVEPDHPEALAGLARLYEETEQWDRAVEIMGRLVSVVDAKEKVDLNYRLGKIFDEQMQMPESAEECLVEALSVDPAHVPSMLSLLNLYKRRGDSLKAAQLMVRAEACTQNPLEKTRLLFEAGKIYQNELGDEQKAKDLFARTLELDPEHVEAAEPLAEIYFHARGVGAARSGARDAGAQDRPPRQPGAARPLLPPGQGGRQAGRAGEGAQVLPAGLRARSDPPADLGGSRRSALPTPAVGRRLQAVPDRPGPAPRIAEGRADRRDLPPHRHHQDEAGRARQVDQHVREGARDQSRAPADPGGAGRLYMPRPATGRR